MTLPKKHLSPTQVLDYLNCPLQYQKKYVDRIQMPTPLGLLIKVQTHDTILMKALGERMDNESVVDYHGQALAKRMEDVASVNFLDRDLHDALDHIGKELRWMTYLLRTESFGALIADIKPLAIETTIEGEIGGYPFSGRLDVETDTCIIDLKRSMAALSTKEPAESIQLVSYAILRKKDRVALWMLFDSPDRPSARFYASEVTEAATYRTHEIFQWAGKNIEAGNFPPIDKTATGRKKFCGPDMCSFWPKDAKDIEGKNVACAYGERGRVPVSTSVNWENTKYV